MVNVFNRLAFIHGKPEVIILDNGPEMIRKVLDQWAYEINVKLHSIDPGKVQGGDDRISSAVVSTDSGPGAGAEIVWTNGRVIRYSQVDLLLDFLKKSA